LNKKKAYVFIKVAAGKLDSIMRTMSRMPEVLSVEGVSGHVDVVAVMVGPDLETLQNTILSTVRGTDGIESTETWIVMVPQPTSWTQEELDKYVADSSTEELTAIRVMIEKGRSMMVPELIDHLADRLGDENFDVHNLIITFLDMTRRAEEEYRRENFIDFEEDTGFFLDERYIEKVKESLSKVSDR
jgi:Lrp/AsnC ligand binding domain